MTVRSTSSPSTFRRNHGASSARSLLVVMLFAACAMLHAAGEAPLPRPAKPLLLDLLDTCRGEWRHPTWLGQVMLLDGPITGLFAVPTATLDKDKPRLGTVLTPSDAPDAWERAEVRWIEPGEDGTYKVAGERWSLFVSLARLSHTLVRADLTELRFDQAFRSPFCLANLVLATADGAITPLALMPVGPTPSYRLETDAVGHLAVGSDRLAVRVLGHNPLHEPRNTPLRLTLRDKLTGEPAGALPVSLPLAPNAFANCMVEVALPRFGVLEAQLDTDPPGEAPLAEIRLARVVEPRTDITPEASSFGINLFQHQLWWYTFQPPLLRAAGAKWVRPWLAWENTWRMQEPAPGHYDFTHLENALDRLEPLGLAYEHVLFSSPESVGGSSALQSPPPPDKMTLWEDWVRALVTRFRGRIQHYEAWNEPDMMWPGVAGENADQYVRLLEATYRAAKAADPECFIDAPSSAGYRGWLTDAVREGARPLTDVFTFHSYAAPAAITHHLRTRLDLWSGAAGWEKPVWVNEIGTYACDFNPEYNAQVKGNEHIQAQTLVGDMALVLAERPQGKVFWFCSLDPHDPFHTPEWAPDADYVGDAGTGLLYEGFLPKLAFATFAGFAREFDGHRALGQWYPAPYVHVVAFAGERAVVSHEDRENATPFPATALGCPPEEILTVLDSCGNELGEGTASETTLDCSHGPLYVRGSAALERRGAAWGVITRLRPPAIIAPGDAGRRVASLPAGASVTVDAPQHGEAIELTVEQKGNEATLSLRAATDVQHALAYARLRLQTDRDTLEQVFPITTGVLSLFDAPGFTTNPEALCTRERQGGIAWSATEGHLAPGCLVLAEPYDARLVNWQQWYLGLQTEKPLRWSLWVKAEGFVGANCRIAIAQFGREGWLGDRLLMTPEQCPSGDSAWVHVEGRVEPTDFPDGLQSMALYVDIAPTGDAQTRGQLLIDELDVWQPAR